MLPHFIGIGSVKSATSWLNLILKKHPMIWMPPMKELHYFNRRNNRSHFGALLFEKDNIKSKNRFRNLRRLPKKQLFWSYNYFFKKRNINYYQSLFTPSTEQICGEITPKYHQISDNKIKEVFSTIPNVKIIYLLRNPIERDWSQLCMTFKNRFQKDPSKSSTKELSLYYKPKYILQSSYAQHSTRWEKYFDSHQIFYGFYEEVNGNPYEFTEQIFDFLGVPKLQKDQFTDLLYTKVNSYTQPIPMDFKKIIAAKELENIKAAHDKFQNQYTAQWLQHVHQILNE